MSASVLSYSNAKRVALDVYARAQKQGFDKLSIAEKALCSFIIVANNTQVLKNANHNEACEEAIKRLRTLEFDVYAIPRKAGDASFHTAKSDSALLISALRKSSLHIAARDLDVMVLEAQIQKLTKQLAAKNELLQQQAEEKQTKVRKQVHAKLKKQSVKVTKNHPRIPSHYEDKNFTNVYTKAGWIVYTPAYNTFAFDYTAVSKLFMPTKSGGSEFECFIVCGSNVDPVPKTVVAYAYDRKEANSVSQMANRVPDNAKIYPDDVIQNDIEHYKLKDAAEDSKKVNPVEGIIDNGVTKLEAKGKEYTVYPKVLAKAVFPFHIEQVKFGDGSSNWCVYDSLNNVVAVTHFAKTANRLKNKYNVEHGEKDDA